MELSDQQVIDLFTTLGRIEQRQEGIEERLGDGPLKCPVHEVEIATMTKRLDAHEAKLSAVQTVIGKKELIVAAFGALGFGLAWALRYLVGKVTQ